MRIFHPYLVLINTPGSSKGNMSDQTTLGVRVPHLNILDTCLTFPTPLIGVESADVIGTRIEYQVVWWVSCDRVVSKLLHTVLHLLQHHAP